MIRWVELGTARVPGGTGELRLRQRGTEFAIFAGADELMGTRLSGSEEALATLTADRLQDRARPAILIGVDVLRHFQVVTLDFYRKVVVFTPAPPGDQRVRLQSRPSPGG